MKVVDLKGNSVEFNKPNYVINCYIEQKYGDDIFPGTNGRQTIAIDGYAIVPKDKFFRMQLILKIGRIIAICGLCVISSAGLVLAGLKLMAP